MTPTERLISYLLQLDTIDHASWEICIREYLRSAGIATVQRWRLGERVPERERVLVLPHRGGPVYEAYDCCTYQHWELPGLDRLVTEYQWREFSGKLINGDPTDEYVLLRDLFPEGR